MASVGSVQNVEPVLYVLQHDPDRGKALNRLVQRVDPAAKGPKFEYLRIGIDLGGFVTSSSQKVPLGWSCVSCQR